MQIPSVERTVNWPPAAAQEPNTPPVTAAIQEATTRLEAVSTPTPSVKLNISTTKEEIAQLEAATQTRTTVRAVPKGEAAEAKAVQAVGGVDASTPPAVNLTAAATETGTQPRNGLQNESAETVANAAKLLEAGKQPGPNQPLSTEKDPSTDWTTTPKAVEKKLENPLPEPLFKKLLDFLQVLWRAGGDAINVTQTAHQTLNPDKLAEWPLTYADPSAVK